MALFVLRKGFRVISTDQGAHLIGPDGKERPLTALEVQVLARASQGGLNHKAAKVPAIIKKLAELGLLDEVEVLPKAPEPDLDEIDIDVTEVSSAAPRAPALKLEDVARRFRSDLKMSPEKSKGVYQVQDPTTGKTFSLYDFEVSLARMLNGRRTLKEIIESGQRLGIPVDLASLTQFLRQLDRYGFLTEPGPSADAGAGQRAQRKPWDEALRSLFQSGMRLSRQGRYAEAASYFEAMLQQDPSNEEARQMLDEAHRHAEATNEAVKISLVAMIEAAAPIEIDGRPVRAAAPPRPRPGRRRPVFALVAAVAVAGAAAAVLLWRKPAPNVRPASTTPAAAPAEPRARPRVDVEPPVAREAPDAARAVAPPPATAAAPEPTVEQQPPVEPAPKLERPEQEHAPDSDDGDAIVVAADKKGRATMGEVVASSDGVLKRRAEQEERVKRSQIVGTVNGPNGAAPLAAPISGLVVWQADDGAHVKAADKLAKLLYHECYVMALVIEGAPTRAFKCEVFDKETGQQAACLVTGVERRAKGWYVTVTSEPTWVERAQQLYVRLTP